MIFICKVHGMKRRGKYLPELFICFTNFVAFASRTLDSLTSNQNNNKRIEKHEAQCEQYQLFRFLLCSLNQKNNGEEEQKRVQESGVHKKYSTMKQDKQMLHKFFGKIESYMRIDQHISIAESHAMHTAQIHTHIQTQTHIHSRVALNMKTKKKQKINTRLYKQQNKS